MSLTWIDRMRRESARDLGRHRKLITKLQKAGAIDRRREVMAKPSWNRRFAFAASLRATKEERP